MRRAARSDGAFAALRFAQQVLQRLARIEVSGGLRANAGTTSARGFLLLRRPGDRSGILRHLFVNPIWARPEVDADGKLVAWN